MKEGAFAVIDCLGFKGIWKRFQGRENIVIDKLCKISNLVKDATTSEKPSSFNQPKAVMDKEVEFQTNFFSDTVFISMRFKKDFVSTDSLIAAKKGLLIKILSTAVIKILDLFIRDEPHLTMRGCISYGNFLYEKEFYVGPAIDTAAEYMDVADGAFIWLHKSASTYYEAWRVENMKQNERNIRMFNLENLSPFMGCELINYSMPIKNMSNLQCYVINPLANFEREKWRREIIEVYEKSMDSNNIQITLKQQNTLKFLEECNDFTYDYYLNHSKLFGREFIK